VSTLAQICRNGFLSIGIRAGTSAPRARLWARPRQSTPEDSYARRLGLRTDRIKGIPTPSPLSSLSPFVKKQLSKVKGKKINHTTNDPQPTQSSLKSLPSGPPVQPYPTIIPSYFASSAGTTLNPKADKAKLLYFQCYFVNYLQSTPLLIPVK